MCKTVQYLYMPLSLSHKPCIGLWLKTYATVSPNLKSSHMKPYSKYALFLIFTLFVQFLYSFTAPTLCAHIAPNRSHQLYNFCTTVICAHCACPTDLLCTAQKLRSRAHCAGLGCAFVTFRNMCSVTNGDKCYRLLPYKSLRLNGKLLFLLKFSKLARSMLYLWCIGGPDALFFKILTHWLSDTSNFLRGHLIGAIRGPLLMRSPVPNPMPCTRPAFMCKLELPAQTPCHIVMDKVTSEFRATAMDQMTKHLMECLATRAVSEPNHGPCRWQIQTVIGQCMHLLPVHWWGRALPKHWTT